MKNFIYELQRDYNSNAAYAACGIEERRNYGYMAFEANSDTIIYVTFDSAKDYAELLDVEGNPFQCLEALEVGGQTTLENGETYIRIF